MFRGKRIDTGEWIEGWFFSPYNAGWKSYVTVGYLCHNKPSYTLFEVHPDSVAMQTGVRDKNKKMIFGSIELDGKMTRGGDRLEILQDANPENNVICSVFWNTKNACWDSTFDYVSNNHGDEYEIIGNNHGDEYEIIGNQYDN